MPSTITSQSMPTSAPRRVKVSTPSTETSPWIVVNQTATVVAKPSTSMKVQATCSLLQTVLDDNANATSNAVAFDWTSGTVAVTTAEQVSNVTAVRFVAVSGAGVGEVGT
jgi:uncharacterized protein YjdB